jgi:hypothetical protein
MNLPSMEGSDLTTAGKFVPHATLSGNKRQERGVGGASHDRDRRKEIERTLEQKYRVSDSREEGE